MHGIFAVDPGGSSGVCWAIFDVKHKLAEEAVKNCINLESITVIGTEIQQIVEICSLWQAFFRACNKSFLPPENVHFAMEDWTGGYMTKGTTGLSPVRIGWGIIGYRMGMATMFERQGMGPAFTPPVRLQEAGLAMSTLPDARMKEWGLWVKGREHERDAIRHLITQLKTIMQQSHV